jgi:hypothetical protein
MRRKVIQLSGIALTIIYATVIVWLYANAPRTLREAAAGASVVAGTYEIDHARFDAALDLFRREQFRAARDEWGRADPAQRDARTQFYIAYAFYREGWGRFRNDEVLFRQGVDAINRAIALTPQNTLTIDDADLRIHSAAELKAELEQGMEARLSDWNPLRVLERERK